MFNFKDFVKKNAILFHSLVSKSITLTHLYVYFLTIILKPLPFHKIKQQVLNSLNSVEWKITDISPPK